MRFSVLSFGGFFGWFFFFQGGQILSLTNLDIATNLRPISKEVALQTAHTGHFEPKLTWSAKTSK